MPPEGRGHFRGRGGESRRAFYQNGFGFGGGRIGMTGAGAGGGVGAGAGGNTDGGNAIGGGGMVGSIKLGPLGFSRLSKYSRRKRIATSSW